MENGIKLLTGSLTLGLSGDGIIELYNSGDDFIVKTNFIERFRITNTGKVNINGTVAIDQENATEYYNSSFKVYSNGSALIQQAGNTMVVIHHD